MNAAIPTIPLQPIQQYHCSIASNQAITPEIVKTRNKTHIPTPIAALLAIVQYQCNIACIPATPMQAFMHSPRPGRHCADRPR